MSFKETLPFDSANPEKAAGVRKTIYKRANTPITGFAWAGVLGSAVYAITSAMEKKKDTTTIGQGEAKKTRRGFFKDIGNIFAS
jgi:hypothetical protein